MTCGARSRSLLALGSRELRRRADAYARMFLATRDGKPSGEAQARVAELRALADEAEQAEQRWIEQVARKLRS